MYTEQTAKLLTHHAFSEKLAEDFRGYEASLSCRTCLKSVIPVPYQVRDKLRRVSSPFIFLWIVRLHRTMTTFFQSLFFLSLERPSVMREAERNDSPFEKGSGKLIEEQALQFAAFAGNVPRTFRYFIY